MLSFPGLTSVSPFKSASFLSPRQVRSGRRKALLEGVSLWLAVLLFLAIQPLYAQAGEAAEGTGTLRYLDDSGQRPVTATLLHTDYRVTVSGLIADTRLKQTFENTSQQWREGVYVFPLPEHASVYALTMTTGDRVIRGEVRPRQEAKARYEAARDKGQQAARVDQQRPNLFTTHLANIPPGEAVTVELSYQQAVRYQSGQFELRLPTTLTPRYMPGETVADPDRPVQWQAGWACPTSAVPDADAISPFTVKPDDVGPRSHRATIELTLNAGLPIGQVTSPSHELTSTWNGDQVRVVPRDGDILMDRDLVVRWSPVRGATPSAAVFHENWQGDDYLLTLLVPGLASQAHLPRELIFVIDTSGSMAGASIRQARASLLRGLDTLGADDRFNVIQFSDQTRSLFPQARPAGAAELSRARAYVNGLTADGGTEMAPALTRALGGDSSDQTGRVRQVVFMTDGAVGNERALFQQIQRQLGHSRLFTVAIGSAPNMHFMREAARFGRGTYTAVTELASLSEPLDQLFAKMQAPVLADIHTRWPGSTATALPQRPGDLFQGEPLVQVIRGQAAAGELNVSGRLPDQSTWQQSIDLGQAAPGTGLHRYWAQQEIERLMDRDLTGETDAGVKQAVTELGVRHQLVTRFTSFLAVDETPVRPAGETASSESVPTLLPDGSTQGMLRYPQTATWAPLLMALGLIGLLPGIALLMLRRRVFE